MIDPQTWWTGGVALAERLPPPPISAGTPSLAESWRSDYSSPALLRARLADRGLDEDGLRALLAEEPAALAGRIERPGWVGTVEDALACAPLDPPLPAGGSWSAGFATVLAPFTETAATRLLRAVERYGLAELTDQEALRGCFTDGLGRALVQLARRTLVLELNVLRVRERLRGSTPEGRFHDFVRQTSARAGLRALVAEYPVLARLLAQTCDQAVAAWTELLRRLVADRTAVVEGLLGGVDPGLLVQVDMSAGDRHQGGRAVAVLSFEHGARVVFKPRPVTVHGHFNDTVRWLNSRLDGLDLRDLAVLERSGYGWVEYAAAAPCAGPAEVGRFYWRLGALLALIHALGATDMHFENLIACADQPVLVDLETLFHPDLSGPAGGDPAQAVLTASVARTALLPFFLVGEHGVLDVSGLGGDRDTPLPGEVTGWSAPGTDEMQLVRTVGVFRGSANRPLLRDAEADPALHVDSLVAGFRAGYDVIAGHRTELTGPGGLLARFTHDVTRAVVRPTRSYAVLLDESTHPDVLRDALDRDRLLDTLWRESAGGPGLRALVGAELAELWAGDVPVAACSPGTTELAVGPLTVDGLVTECGLARAERRIAAMGETDRFDQEWMIRATLATRRRDGGPRAAVAPPGPPAATVPDAERLLATACGIADRILASAQDDGRRVNWLGLEPLDDRIWAVQPLGAGLPHGYCGTALFLAELADLTGTERYTSVARRALAPLPGLLAALAERPADLPAIGAGFAGLGGIAYALSRLATLLDDAEIAGWAAATVDLAAAAAGASPQPGVLDGDAGCLAAMVAVQRATGSAAAGRVARACADRLAAHAPDALPTGGFSTGAAGVGWALLRFAAAGDAPGHAAIHGGPGHAAPGGGQPGHAGANGRPGHATPGGGPWHTATSGTPGHTTTGSQPGHAGANGQPEHATPASGPWHTATSGTPGHATPGGGPGYAAPGSEHGSTATGSGPDHAALGSGPWHTATGGTPGHTTTGSQPGHAGANGQPEHATLGSEHGSTATGSGPGRATPASGPWHTTTSGTPGHTTTGSQPGHAGANGQPEHATPANGLWHTATGSTPGHTTTGSQPGHAGANGQPGHATSGGGPGYAAPGGGPGHTATGGGAAYAAAGLAALRTAAGRCATAPVGTGWCDELSGTALAIADSAAAADVPELAALLDLVVARAAAPTAGDHSLCHGEAGALDLLLAASRAGRARPGAALPRAAALLAALDRFGPRCGTPDSVSSPGLLTGLAGIGHALLQLGFASRVPSVLLLQSPAS
ncbi:type 2 lanthipeptide synthetase LanM [Streptomyces sp. NPDC087270]|uniref:type 2 lanthipeptide synthetase LanM n=1 Tax=Streptomyces sp. NPDC087270 TaxID=3365774 RepID=UPI0038148361